MKNDILTREDIKLLVDRFYDKVQSDPLLGPVFSHVDWPHHLPIMYNFWSSMLLGDQFLQPQRRAVRRLNLLRSNRARDVADLRMIEHVAATLGADGVE